MDNFPGDEMQNFYAAEINLHDDPDEGLRFDCIEPQVNNFVNALRISGFSAAGGRPVVPTTGKFHTIVEVPVKGNSFADMKTIIEEQLKQSAVTWTEEQFHPPGEKHVRLTLNNVDARI